MRPWGLSQITPVLLGLAISCVAVCAGAQSPADTYPSRLVRIVVPFSAGSMSDVFAREIGDKLGTLWNQNVIVENRPGIGGIVATTRADPDGYTLLLVSNGYTIINKINPDLHIDAINGFVGISQIASMPMILIVPIESPAKTLGELIQLARAKPGMLSYASAGFGSASNIAAELFKKVAKLDLAHVPYKGTPDAHMSIMRGDTSMFFMPPGVGEDLIQAGKVRALAVSGSSRLPNLPDVPTFAEAGMSDFHYDAWFGLLTPAGTSPQIVHKLSRDVGQVMQMPDVKSQLLQQGVIAVTSSAEAFDALLKTDAVRFGELFDDLKK